MKAEKPRIKEEMGLPLHLAARSPAGAIVAVTPLLLVASQGITALMAVLALLALLLAYPLAANLMHVRERLSWPPAIPILAAMVALLMLAACSVLWALDPLRGLNQVLRLTSSVVIGVSLLALVRAADRCVIERLVQFTLPTAGALIFVLVMPGEEVLRTQFFNRSAQVLAISVWVLIPVHRDEWPRLLLVIPVASGILASNSESAKLALLTGAISYTLALWLPRLAALTWTVMVPTGIIVQPFLINLGLLQFLPPQLELIAASAPRRIVIWEAFTNVALQRPLFGWGIEAHQKFSRPDYPGSADIEWVIGNVLHPHNAFLQVWVEMGLAGALIAAAISFFSGRAISSLAPNARPVTLGVATAITTIMLVSHGAWQSWWLSAIFLTLIVASSRFAMGAGTQCAVSDLGVNNRDRFPQLMSAHMKHPVPAYLVAAAVAAILIVTAVSLHVFFSKRGATPFVAEPSATEIERTKMNIVYMEFIQKGLARYQAETGSYPVTKDWEQHEGPLRLLTPKYIKKLNSHFASDLKAVILYKSDGRDYKVMAYRIGDCYRVRQLRPAMVDPVRSAGPVDCSAYGVWSDAAKLW